MNTVEWGLVDYCPQVPVICGAEKYSEDRFIVPLVSMTTKHPVSEGAITGLLAHLNDGEVPVISSKIEAVLDGAEMLFPIRDVNDIVGRVLTGWLEDDGVVKALIHIDRDTPNAERVKQALDAADVGENEVVNWSGECLVINISLLKAWIIQERVRLSRLYTVV